MFAVDVFFEILASLLDGLSIDIANIAVILLILLELVGQISETCKGIEHDTRNDVAEEDSEEDTIDCVENESYDLEGVHGLGNSAWNEELEDAVHHALA